MSGEVRVGVTGHQGLTPASEVAVRSAIDELLSRYGEVVGVSSLAEGADQIFADAIVARGGELEAVIPCADYESTFAEPADLEHFLRLRYFARAVTQLNYDEPSEDAFWAAGREIVSSSDVVVAVWNGEHAQGLGGTGDVVEFARSLSKEVHIVWPKGAARK